MKDIVATLQWYQEMGVEDITSSQPFNAFGHIKKKKAANQAKQSKEHQKANNTEAASRAVSMIGQDDPSQLKAQTTQLAQQSQTLEDLKKAVCSFKGLAITQTANNTVFSDGNPKSDVMFIGEAPGADEDIQGIPFCGQSGQLLSNILSYVGLTRQDNYYITNSIFWRPPGNRRPTPEELEICRPFVERHIALIQPKLIVLIGATAVASVLQRKEGITKIRGMMFDYTNDSLSGQVIPAMPMLHPSYLLRSPGQKRFAWADALTLKHFAQEHNIALANVA